MNAIRKASVSMLSLGVLVLGGCVAYPCGEYETCWDTSWDVEIHEDGSSGCRDCSTELEIELNWDSGYSSCSNLDLEVSPPSRYSECSHLGDDPGAYGYGSETVICASPDAGTFRVRAVSWSDVDDYATVVVRELRGDSILSESMHEILVPAWGESLLSVRMD